jgi:hypothetical protein
MVEVFDAIKPERPFDGCADPLAFSGRLYRNLQLRFLCAEPLETLIAKMKRSFDSPARLGALLGDIRASRSLTRMPACGRGGVASLHACHLPKAPRSWKLRRSRRAQKWPRAIFSPILRGLPTRDAAARISRSPSLPRNPGSKLSKKILDLGRPCRYRTSAGGNANGAL